eukprot:2323833-Pyramimonas_sp.AAC.1
MAMAQLVLQHEDNLRNQSRDVNIVLTNRADSKVQMALEAGVDEYNAVGKKEREKEDEFKGHPWGKRPDAQMKMVLYRITEALQANEAAVEAAIQQGPDPGATKQAVKCIAEWSTRVQDTTKIFHATRCFMVTTQDTANHEVKKWIFAICHHPELQQAFM